MPLTEAQAKKWEEKGCAVYCFSGPDDYLLRRAAAGVLKLLSAEDAEPTYLEQEAPAIEEIVAAAGTISFFGTRRLVVMPYLQPARYSEGELTEFCETLAVAEQAVFVLLCLQKTEKGHLLAGKNEKKLFEACKKLGYYECVEQPSPAQLKQLLVQQAGELGTRLTDQNAGLLMERCGQDGRLLQAELEKLCAICGYTEVTGELIRAYSVPLLEEDVFEMVGSLTAGKTTNAMQKLKALLAARNDPIAIAAALNYSYVDLYRAALALKRHKSFEQLHADFKYTGKPYRLKYVMASAGRYSLKGLEDCIEILAQLDADLKSKPVSGAVLLETAVCSLALCGAK